LFERQLAIGNNTMIAIPQVISLKFVSKSGQPVGYLMVETEDGERAKQVARLWAEKGLKQSFAIIEIHQGEMDKPSDAPEVCDGVRVWELPF
jgi:hypothetical protein